MPLNAILVIVIGLAYFVALLLADRMERLGFEALSNDNRFFIAEATPQSQNGKKLLILWIIVSICSAAYINMIGYGFPTMLQLVTIVLPIAIGAFYYYRSLSKNYIDNPKLASQLPQPYQQSKKIANLVRMVATATLISSMLLLLN